LIDSNNYNHYIDPQFARYLIFFFYQQGGRGFFQALWPECATINVANVREQYTSSYPSNLNYTESTEYGKQSLTAVNKIRNFDPRYSTLCAKYEGYFKPPYTGMFKLMVNADDRGEFWFSQCTNNCSKSDLV